MNGHGGKVLRFENAHRNPVYRAGRVAEDIHAPTVDRVVGLHRLDDMAQQQRSIVAHAPALANDGVRPGQNDAFLLRERLPVLDEDPSVATRTVKEDDERRRFRPRAIRHEQRIGAVDVLRHDGLLRDLLGVRVRSEQQHEHR